MLRNFLELIKEGTSYILVFTERWIKIWSTQFNWNDINRDWLLGKTVDSVWHLWEMGWKGKTVLISVEPASCFELCRVNLKFYLRTIVRVWRVRPKKELACCEMQQLVEKLPIAGKKRPSYIASFPEELASMRPTPFYSL